jgi:membrane-associated protease RseP (regulator of RpoE activity)
MAVINFLPIPILDGGHMVFLIVEKLHSVGVFVEATSVEGFVVFGDDVDGAVAHFRAKVEGYDMSETGSAPAQMLVGLLARLDRYSEAVDISLRYLSDVNPSELGCPTAVQLCFLAGDFDRLRTLSRERGDLLNYTAQALATPKTYPGS